MVAWSDALPPPPVGGGVGEVGESPPPPPPHAMTAPTATAATRPTPCRPSFVIILAPGPVGPAMPSA